MVLEDRDVLLKDLCTRLPYGVIVRGVFLNYSTDKGKILYEEYDKLLNYQDLNRYESLKPYLRPMSSMTKEERKEYEGFIIHREHINAQGQEWDIDCFSFNSVPRLINWLNAHHFDYHELIDRGLAIEVTEENNPYKE